MPRGQLKTEDRLRQVITRLKNINANLRTRLGKALTENKDLRSLASQLQLKLEDKEAQRKHLLEHLYKPSKKTAKKKAKKTRKKAFRREAPKDSEVTEETRFTPTKCPYCKKRDGLSEAKETIIKYQEDIIIVPEKIVKKYIITKHWCSHCQEYVRSDKVPADLERIGANVMAYILYARYRLRLPYNKIQQSLRDLHNFEISEGEIANQFKKAEQLFKNDFKAVKELIKISDKVYCDETGWRVQGKNFWIWVFTAPNAAVRYVIEDTRGKGVAENALGDKEDRVLISDFYGAYTKLPGKHQYCWVHLLRDGKLIDKDCQFHLDLKEVYKQLSRELTKNLKKRKPRRLDKLLDDIVRQKYKYKGKNKAENRLKAEKTEKLQRRIKKYKKELLTCLSYKDILPENNTAERALRNAVVMRKIFNGSRSVSGAKTMEANLTVIDSLMAKNPSKGFFGLVLPRIKKLRGCED